MVKTIELGAEGDDVYGLLGYCYLNLERYSSALDAYSRALLFKPESKDWKQGKAQCLFAMEAYTSAISLFDELILDMSKISSSNNEMALVYASMANRH